MKVTRSILDDIEVKQPGMAREQERIANLSYDMVSNRKKEQKGSSNTTWWDGIH